MRFKCFSRKKAPSGQRLKNLKSCVKYVLYTIKKKKIVKKLVNRSFLLIFSFLVSDMSESLILLKSNERCEPIAQVAHQK